MATSIDVETSRNSLTTNKANLSNGNKFNHGHTRIRSVDDGAGDSASNEPSESTSPPDQISYPSGAKFWLIVTNLSAILVLVSLDGSIVATAVPSITDQFHTIADVGWYSSAFRLCICAFQFLFGKAYTLFPVKRVFTLSNLISMLGFLLCATAVSSPMFVIGRAVAGLGCSGLVAGCFTVLTYTMPLARRPFIIGILCGAESIAIISAPLLGGVITQTLGWRWCFYITLPPAALTLILTLLCIPENPHPSPLTLLPLFQKLSHLDLPSNLLLLPGLTTLFLALSRAGSGSSWFSSSVLVPLIFSFALLLGFLLNQHRLGPSASLSLRIARHRSVAAGAIYIACANATIVVLEYFLPTYYQVVRGDSPARSGAMMLPMILSAAVANVFLGWSIGATGHYAPFMLLSSVLMPVAAGVITAVFRPGASVAEMLGVTAFAGFANGIGFSGPQTAPQAVLGEEDVAMGLAIVLFAQSFGPALGVAVAEVVFAGQLVRNLKGLVPGFDQGGLTSVGLKGIVERAPVENLGKMLAGVNKSITHTWYLAVGFACATMIGSLLIEWRSVKEPQPSANSEA